MNDFSYATQFQESFQAHLLAVACRTPGFVLKYRSALSHEYFTNVIHRTVARALFAHIDKFAGLPSKELLKEATDDYAKDSEVYALCRKYISKAYKREIPDTQAVMARAIEFGKQQAMCNAVMKAAERIQRGDHTIMPLIQEATLVGQDITDMGMSWDTVSPEVCLSWYNESLNPSRLITSGIPHLDHALGGGLGRGELGVIFGPPKRGKSMALINMAYGALCSNGIIDPVTAELRPLRVAYYTLEMNLERLAMRFDARLCGQYLDYRASAPEKFVEIVTERRKQHIHGELFIKHYPTRTMTPSLLRTHLSLLQSDGWAPDLLIVDYADIMKAERRTEDMRHAQAGIYEDLRTIAHDYNCAVWTGSQANRSSMDKPTLNIGDLAESFEKAAIADALIAMCQTKEEVEAQESRLVLAALRNAEDGGAIKCVMRRNMSLMQSVGYYDVAGLPVCDDRLDIPDADKGQAEYTASDLRTDPIPNDRGNAHHHGSRKTEPTRDVSSITREHAKTKEPRKKRSVPKEPRKTLGKGTKTKTKKPKASTRARLGGKAKASTPAQEPKRRSFAQSREAS